MRDYFLDEDLVLSAYNKGVSNSESISNLNTSVNAIDAVIKTGKCYFDETLGEYVNVGSLWPAENEVFGVEFSKFSVTPAMTGTKTKSNAGKVCTPSTAAVAGQDDYQAFSAFKVYYANGYFDSNNREHVTALYDPVTRQSDGRFAFDGSNGNVWVIANVNSYRYYRTDTVIGWEVCARPRPAEGFFLTPGGTRLDGSQREFMMYAKYNLSFNGAVPQSMSGKVTAHHISHNSLISSLASTNYCGVTNCDRFYVQVMDMLKHAVVNLENKKKGCISYYLQYTAALSETGVKRIAIATASANNLVVGSTVSIGNAITEDRENSSCYSLANRVNITSIEVIDGTNSYVYVDSATTFDVVAGTTKITTYPYNTGFCDTVLGVDGSRISNSSGKEPYISQGIELMVGAYEILGNQTLYYDANGLNVLTCNDKTKFSTAPFTSGNYYVNTKKLPPSSLPAAWNWDYFSDMEIDPNDPGTIVPTANGASSSTGLGDAGYLPYAGFVSTTNYVWRALGALSSGGAAGPFFVGGASSVSGTTWYFLSRLSGLVGFQR